MGRSSRRFKPKGTNMTLPEAEAEYDRLLLKRSTPEELATGLKELREQMDRLNIINNKLCDNDNEGDMWP